MDGFNGIFGFDDEGYTSPVEEDFKHDPIYPNVKPKLRTWTVYCDPPKRELSWNKPLKYFVKPSLTTSWLNRENLQGSGDKGDSSEDEFIAWDEVAKLPVSPKKHLSWDCLEAPFPHRFQANHVLLCRNQRKIGDERSFMSDSTEQANKFLKCFWKDCSRLDRAARRNSYTAGGGGDNIPQANEVSTAVQQLKDCLDKPTYIPVNQFLIQAFHLLSGVESTTFQLYSTKGGRETFRKNPTVLVDGISPTALWEYCIPLIDCGSIVKRLNQYYVLQFDNELLKKQGFERSAVMIAFLRFIANYMKMYQTILMLNTSVISGLTQLLKFIRVRKYYKAVIVCLTSESMIFILSYSLAL